MEEGIQNDRFVNFNSFLCIGILLFNDNLLILRKGIAVCPNVAYIYIYIYIYSTEVIDIILNPT